jgi:hypothetical protein
MLVNVRRLKAFLVCVAIGSMTNGASAISLDVAKKCHATTAKAFPPREVGNPAAGSAKGSGQVQQEYFRKCAANGGNGDDNSPKERR